MGLTSFGTLRLLTLLLQLNSHEKEYHFRDNTIEIKETFANIGTVENNAQINADFGTIINRNVFNNRGTIEGFNSNFENTGTMNNFGSMDYSSTDFLNNGIITNDGDLKITSSTITNDDVIINRKAFDFSGIFNNNRLFENDCLGTVGGSPILGEPVFLTCRTNFDDFGFGGTSFGKVIKDGDQLVKIEKTIPSSGIAITAHPGGGLVPAKISVCGDSAIINLNAGDEIGVICSSVTIKVIKGTIDIEFLTSGGPITTTLDEGEELTFDPITLEITAPPENLEDVIVEIGGEQITISPGQTIHVDIPGAPIGGTFIPIEQTSLILAGAQMTASWLVPVIVSAVGIGLVLVRRNSVNS